MIDVAIGFRQPPTLWILVEGPSHILMYFLLQIDSDFAKCSNNDVRANSGVQRNVAVRVSDADIIGIVTSRYSGLRNGSLDQIL